MKHLELHILQSVPVTCLNRDDLGSPKTAFFGGVQRARVSSQSWKRAIREYAHEISPYFEGKRSRLIIDPLKNELKKLGKSEEESLEGAKSIASVIGKMDSDAEKKELYRVKTVHYTSKSELEAIANLFTQYLGELDDDPLSQKVSKQNEADRANDDQKKKIVKEINALEKKIASVGQKAVKAIGVSVLKDVADLALFGRMVANDHSLTIDGAAMFNHPISTHKVDNELDFFATVDDWQKEGDSGAGMTGTLEFNSSVYYRFAALNLDMLADKEHLACMTTEERKEVVSAFVQATLEAVPGMTSSNSGRKNSMNGYTRPSYVLGIVRSKGHPIQFINAFEEPVWSGAGRGIMKTSIEKLQKEEEQQNKTWMLKKYETGRAVMPEQNIDAFIKEMVTHVD
ncbi:MAG: type I-E CRISPR-associated protein Cas7/Cse4/CasC [Desulfobacteraceae bacterium]|nr:type I-E CRISPR-associated protein Cas7/Cse4/CasC [Desulfobacteraceae bacterium]